MSITDMKLILLEIDGGQEKGSGVGSQSEHGDTNERRRDMHAHTVTFQKWLLLLKHSTAAITV
jgi:hypothetical protein